MSGFFLASEISLTAPSLDKVGFGSWLTNSVFVAALVVIVVVAFARGATRHMAMVPAGSQNLFEALVELLYDLIETIVGKRMTPRCFSLLATIFIFILASNLFGLLPGVGTIGWRAEGDAGFHIETPLLRPCTADVNMTLAMAMIFMVMWAFWTWQQVGLWGFLKHTFGPQGGGKGLALAAMTIIFFLVGIIEMISIAFRPVSLSLRLFGNTLAGEALLETMIGLGQLLHAPEWVSGIMAVTAPLPFYFFELLVAVIQASVFMLLCAAYLRLSTSHGDEE